MEFINSLIICLKEKRVKPGEIIIEQNNINNSIYYVINGRVNSIADKCNSKII